MQNHKYQQELKKFGVRVRQARLEAGLSQEGLADRANVHRTYIGMIERGEKNLTLSSMLNIAHALQIKLIDLLQGL